MAFRLINAPVYGRRIVAGLYSITITVTGSFELSNGTYPLLERARAVRLSAQSHPFFVYLTPNLTAMLNLAYIPLVKLLFTILHGLQ